MTTVWSEEYRLIVKDQEWVHSKTQRVYVVEQICYLEATAEPCVAYWAKESTNPKTWIRPVREWFERVPMPDGTVKPRFVLVQDSPDYWVDKKPKY